MSEIKVNKISPRTACGTVTLGDSGDTFTIPAGATITNNGTAAGFGATGAASWDTTVKTSGFTAVSGVGYFVNTTSGAITVTLPASPDAGAVVAVSDYAGTADTNAITIGRNGSNINGAAADLDIQQENSAVTLVYVDGTQGWKATDTSSLTDVELQPAYVTATGGTITCSGDYKIHTFTSPGTFTVSAVGNPLGSTTLEYLVVAGGGAGGRDQAGGGGAGGLKNNFPSPATGGLAVTATGYPVTIGAGGARPATPSSPGERGSSTSFAGSTTITSAGGGGGSGNGNPGACTPGGSGGGGDSCTSGGTGNTPVATPAQGTNGGSGNANYGGGGGGATVAGGNGGNPAGGTGGNGTGFPTAFVNTNGQPSGGLQYFAGGGGGSAHAGGSHGTGGLGGGGQGGGTTTPQPTTAGAVNQGGGGGGCGNNAFTCGSGGSGIVIIRYKFQN
jgi:hypothetical protein